jgi:hypothetical protein
MKELFVSGSAFLQKPAHNAEHTYLDADHCGPQQDDVRASTSGALPKRIRRPTGNHIRFISLKNFPDRLLDIFDDQPRIRFGA